MGLAPNFPSILVKKGFPHLVAFTLNATLCINALIVLDCDSMLLEPTRVSNL
jgi:hypothetical protein